MRISLFIGLSFLTACGGLEDEESGGRDSGTATQTGDQFGWDTADDDGNDWDGNDEESDADTDTDTDTDSDADADSDTDTDSDTDSDVTELASGSYDVTSGDAEPVPSEGRVIVAVACQGDFTGVQVHALNDSTGNQDYWFDLDTSGEDGPEHDDGEFLMDNAVDVNTVLWSEMDASMEDTVKLNGYAWDSSNWTWLAGGDTLFEAVCLGAMIHDDGTFKLCLPEDNGLNGGDLVCNPADNGTSAEDQIVDAFIEALQEQYDEYYADDGSSDSSDDGGSSSSTRSSMTITVTPDSSVDGDTSLWVFNRTSWSGSWADCDTAEDDDTLSCTVDAMSGDVLQFNGDAGDEDYLVNADESDVVDVVKIDGTTYTQRTSGSTAGTCVWTDNGADGGDFYCHVL